MFDLFPILLIGLNKSVVLCMGGEDVGSILHYYYAGSHSSCYVEAATASLLQNSWAAQSCV